MWVLTLHLFRNLQYVNKPFLRLPEDRAHTGKDWAWSVTDIVLPSTTRASSGKIQVPTSSCWNNMIIKLCKLGSQSISIRGHKKCPIKWENIKIGHLFASLNEWKDRWIIRKFQQALSCFHIGAWALYNTLQSEFFGFAQAIAYVACQLGFIACIIFSHQVSSK